MRYKILKTYIVKPQPLFVSLKKRTTYLKTYIVELQLYGGNYIYLFVLFKNLFCRTSTEQDQTQEQLTQEFKNLHCRTSTKNDNRF